MGIEAWIVLAVLAAIIAALAMTRIAPDAILLAGLTLLMAVPVPTAAGLKFGVLSVRDGVAGFGNPGMITVAVLFIVVCGLRETGGIDWLAERVLGRPRGLRRAIGRIILPTWGMSVFLNNTPVVAMLIPAVIGWARRLRISPSKLLIPLSYAAILGGTCSLIGTSTNLVVAGLVLSEVHAAPAAAAQDPAVERAAPRVRPLRMFDITWIGLPCATIGAAFLILVGPRLLPGRKSVASVLADPREYTLELIVSANSPLAGRTVEQAGLRNLPGCYLVEIERDDEILPAVGPQQVLHEGDRLLFAGIVDSIKELQNIRGLALATDQIFKLDAPRYRRRLFEAVVSPTSPVAGRSVREGRFRNRYDGAIVAVARNGERIRGKIGDIRIRPGDVLLVEADPGFGERHRNSRDFLLVSALEDSTPRSHHRAPLAVVILAAMVALATFEVYPMLVAAMLAAGGMVALRCCTVSQARRSVDWSVLVVIGAALGLGRAMDTSGAATGIADSILAVASTHPWLALLAVYLVTSLLTEIITNNASVALVFPIAKATAMQLDVSFMPFVIAIMMAGSASFATPLGYQTNLMVYGPGGYKFLDFVRIGLPMNLLMCAVAVSLIPWVFGF